MAGDAAQTNGTAATAGRMPLSTVVVIEKGMFTLFLLVALVGHVAISRATAPLPGGGGVPSTSAETPRCPRVVNSATLSQVLACLVALDQGSCPPSPAQKKRFRPPAVAIVDSVDRIQADLRVVVAVLDPAQAGSFFERHVLADDPTLPPEDATPEDPRLARAMALLVRKAGPRASASAAPTVAAAPTARLPGTLGSASVLDGIAWLETASATPLSTAQARTALDALEDLQRQSRRAAAAVREIQAGLDARQGEALSSMPSPGRPDLQEAAARLLLWTEGR